MSSPEEFFSSGDERDHNENLNQTPKVPSKVVPLPKPTVITPPPDIATFGNEEDPEEPEPALEIQP